MILILGNGGGGTSLLRGLINAHPAMSIEFEHKGGPVKTPGHEQAVWRKIGSECDLIWGNKIPIEQFISRKYTDADIVPMVDEYQVIFIFRRFSKYWQGRASTALYHTNWKWCQELYWAMRERQPSRVISVSFEDLLLRTQSELRRICDFIGVEYDPIMISGTNDTGYKKYNHGKILLEKL